MKPIYEDNHLIVINKRCSELVQGDITGDKPLSEMVKEFIKIRDKKPGDVYLGVPHRLDRPTSGIVMFTKTSKSLTRLNKMFQNKDLIKKTYWAVVAERPRQKEEKLTHWLVRNSKQNRSYAYDKKRSDAKESSLTYRHVASSDKYFLLEIDLHTGRHHQIRAQLSAINLTIKGDLKYGAKRSNKDGGIHLHARKIAFEHPVSKSNIEIVAPTPKDPVWNFFSKKATDLN